MRYFIHIVTDLERLVDQDGQECESLEAALIEARQSALHLMAEELRCGRAMPFGWRMQIADDTETVMASFRFADLIFGSTGSQEKPVDPRLIERARSSMARAKQSFGELQHGIQALQATLRDLAKLRSRHPH